LETKTVDEKHECEYTFSELHRRTDNTVRERIRGRLSTLCRHIAELSITDRKWL